MRATSSTTPWTWSGVIVATEPTSSPVAGLKDSSVDWDGGACVAVSMAVDCTPLDWEAGEVSPVPITAFGGEIWCRFAAGVTQPWPLREAPATPHPPPHEPTTDTVILAAVPDRLFGSDEERPAEAIAADAPLAVRMRPRSLDELVGQEHILNEGSALRTSIEEGHPHSAILYGPPGAGKTTLARIAAAGADGAFEEESAVNAGRAEIRAVIARPRERRQANGRHTVLFLDEIHRFNKAQQDALLPAVEEGLLTLIGATTENHYFEVNSPLPSRCQSYELAPLEPEQVEELLRRALADPERGLADPPPGTDPAPAR